MICVIENEYLKAYISDLGATLIKLIDKQTNIDLVLGFDAEEDYFKYSGTNMGASIGRNANRIGGGSFVLNEQKYYLTQNDNNNQLHGGGANGFAFKRWNVIESGKDYIIFDYYSTDKEEGYPGNLRVEVSYTLNQNNIIWKYSGKSDKDTLLNMTNHSYFCLGDDDILNQQLMIYTNKYSHIDDYSLTIDKVCDTINTPYDFYSFKKIKYNLSKLKNGIDNNYVWEYIGNKLMASLKNDRLQLNVYSDLPDMHLYTAYYLNGERGKYFKTYRSYSGICLECQYYPNSINYDSFIKPILHSNETMTHYIRYEINNI